ncbi:hypothetical protein DD235_03115 [Corticimicrobacter populi]|uniref:Uncharacterized protein n=1 Tax=Corticimicrobacter populi TaxID=2175229 RepID=A0A2V1K2X3_9BURK|nr:hypothetical protein DD235_03115 [Corticimicrobacter populi]
MHLSRAVQLAMLGEVPHTLRFLYVSLIDQQLNFHAVFTDDASEDHIESAHRVLTEIMTHCPAHLSVNEKIELDSAQPWKIGLGEHLMYLRYGELSPA